MQQGLRQLQRPLASRAEWRGLLRPADSGCTSMHAQS
jgi:hypothetical protein